ncbi:MAG: AzlD domain-containing protein [Succinivibrio sp.]
MTQSEYYSLIVLLSFVATYPVRVIPALFISKLNLSPYFQRVLDLVPYTALTALVFPGIFYCVENGQYASYIGTAVAIIAAVCRASLSIVVLLSVVAVYLTLICL